MCLRHGPFSATYLHVTLPRRCNPDLLGIVRQKLPKLRIESCKFPTIGASRRHGPMPASRSVQRNMGWRLNRCETRDAGLSRPFTHPQQSMRNTHHAVQRPRHTSSPTHRASHPHARTHAELSEQLDGDRLVNVMLLNTVTVSERVSEVRAELSAGVRVEILQPADSNGQTLTRSSEVRSHFLRSFRRPSSHLEFLKVSSNTFNKPIKIPCFTCCLCLLNPMVSSGSAPFWRAGVKRPQQLLWS